MLSVEVRKRWCRSFYGVGYSITQNPTLPQRTREGRGTRLVPPTTESEASDKRVRPTRTLERKSICRIGFGDLVDCALSGAQGNRDVHSLVGIIYVHDDRPAMLSHQNMFAGLLDFDEHTVGAVVERGNGGVNDGQRLAHIV